MDLNHPSSSDIRDINEETITTGRKYPTDETNSKLMDMSTNQMAQKIRNKSENSATGQEQNYIGKRGEEGETEERGQEQNKEDMEGGSHSETLTMQASSVDDYNHYDRRSSPMGTSISTVEPNSSLHSDSSEEFKTPSATPGTSPNHHSSPRKVHCSNCPRCEKVKQIAVLKEIMQRVEKELLGIPHCGHQPTCGLASLTVVISLHVV